MGELGSGAGSSYPGSLDSDATLEVDAPAGGKTKARADVVNDLASAIVAIETELGVNPAGTKATLVARIDQEHEADGTHKDSLVCVLSGIQTHTGQKTYTSEIVAQSGIDPGIWGFSGSATAVVSNRVVTTSGGHIIPAGGIDAGGHGTYIKTKIIEIGAWDMDATGQVQIAHGLTKENIRRVSVVIRRDDDLNRYVFPVVDPGVTDNELIFYDTDDVKLTRGNAGFFDSILFDQTNINRGWITIDYV